MGKVLEIGREGQGNNVGTEPIGIVEALDLIEAGVPVLPEMCLEEAISAALIAYRYYKRKGRHEDARSSLSQYMRLNQRLQH
jgi:hypothetical protein